jgi:glycosyltransferase involved in cell wall biosynthesis
MSEPAFSAIVSAHNEQELIGSAIESVLRQTREDWELIVVDDGSKDATAERVAAIADRDTRIRLISKAVNEGLGAGLNTGIEHSSASYVSLLDADDLWMPDYLATMGEALDAAPDAGFAYTDAWGMDGRTRRIRRKLAMAPYNPPADPPEDPIEVIRLLLPGNFIFGLTTMRRSVLDQVGVFDPSLGSAEDLDLWLRILAAGHRAVRPSGVHAIRRERPDAMSMNTLRMLSNLRAVLVRVADDPRLPDDVHETARARVAACDRRYDALTGDSRVGGAVVRARRRLSPLRAFITRPLVWRSRRPAEVESAFPDLDRL